MSKSDAPLGFESVCLREDGKAVCIVDQSLLPQELRVLELELAQDMCEAIAQLKVRGAPAIGVAAAYCYYVLAAQAMSTASGAEDLRGLLRAQGALLASTRPTAVNLSWALARMQSVVDEAPDSLDGHAVLLSRLEDEAHNIRRETVQASVEIARLGAGLLRSGDGVLTHCNAGPLACLGYGTALAPILYAHEQGVELHVFVDETRPLLQGARLTSFELNRAGVDATLICDNMASLVMREGRVQACMVGCDRVAANGDVANKIGTSGVAILAKHYGIPFYVLGPTSTIDLSCANGADIPIEVRDGAEIRQMFYKQPMALEDVACYNPAFDITDHELVGAIITERGICYPPFDLSLAGLFSC